MVINKKEFHQRTNAAGSLSFLEAQKDIPFEIKRVYYIYKTTARRGFHAHKKLQQYLICLNGQCTIYLDDGTEQREVVLNDPNEGLYIGPGTWREMDHFSEGAVLLVLASEYYDPSDYIRDYDAFLQSINREVEP